MPKTTSSTEAQVDKLMSLPKDKPIIVLNLFEFNDQAKYQPEDPEYGTEKADITGREALQTYFEAGKKITANLGVKRIFGSTVDQVMVGPENIQWDMSVTLLFPTRQAFIDMMSHPDFKKASRHRKAALANQYNIHINGDGFEL